MLSNIIFIITLILLIIILIALYFISNDNRKNKNKLNICESDMNSMRERLSNLTQRVVNLEHSCSNEPKKSSRGSQNFSDILEQLGSFGGNGMPYDEQDEVEDEYGVNDEEDEEEDDEEDDEEEDDEEEDEEEDDEEEDEEEDDEEDEEEDEEEDDEEEDEEVVEEKDDNTEVIVQEIIEEETKNDIPQEEVKINSILEAESKDLKKKLPKAEPSKLDIGTVDVGTDKKTKYSIQLNKAGKKYWKKL